MRHHYMLESKGVSIIGEYIVRNNICSGLMDSKHANPVTSMKGAPEVCGKETIHRPSCLSVLRAPRLPVQIEYAQQLQRHQHVCDALDQYLLPINNQVLSFCLLLFSKEGQVSDPLHQGISYLHLRMVQRRVSYSVLAFSFGIVAIINNLPLTLQSLSFLKGKKLVHNTVQHTYQCMSDVNCFLALPCFSWDSVIVKDPILSSLYVHINTFLPDRRAISSRFIYSQFSLKIHYLLNIYYKSSKIHKP